MTDIALTAANIGRARPDMDEVLNLKAGATITAGQAVYFDTDGEVIVSDASALGTAKFLGIALNSATAGRPVQVLVRGFCYGFTLTGINYGTIVYLSDTAGALADAAGMVSMTAGMVMWLEGQRVLFVNGHVR